MYVSVKIRHACVRMWYATVKVLDPEGRWIRKVSEGDITTRSRLYGVVRILGDLVMMSVHGLCFLISIGPRRLVGVLAAQDRVCVGL